MSADHAAVTTRPAPTPLGTEPSIGFGDRLGLGTPGHVAALREAGGPIRGVFAQQSIREMTRTGRSAETIMAAAVDALAALDPGLLRADILYNCDALTVTPGRSTLTLGLRGLTGFTVEVRGAQTDLHSGIHGGMAPNPALVLARLLAALHDDTGRIAVPGFYDGVVDPTPQERALANADAPSAAEYAAQTGVPPVGGESAFTPAERAGFRPTLEINGFHSGYGGPGSKTIIPAVAQAKITLRLAAGQDPAACLHRVRRFLEHRLPAGLKIAFTETAAGAPALKGDVNAPAIRTAAAILTELDGRPPAFHWEGGSIPIMARLPALTGAQPLIVGFGSTTDRIHAPDESFSWSQFRQGFRFAVRFLGPSA